MHINPSKSKAIRFTRARVKDPLNYSLMGTLIPEASSCKYLGISCADQVEPCSQHGFKVTSSDSVCGRHQSV